MRILFISFFVFSLFTSCKKNENKPLSNYDILKKYKWHLDFTHKVVYDSSFNTGIVSKIIDTSYSSSDCEKKSTYQFLNNGIFILNLACYNNLKKEGTWGLSKDSILFALAQFTFDNPGGPPSSYYFGINDGKLILISESEFKVSNEVLLYYYQNNGLRGQTKTVYINTFIH